MLSRSSDTLPMNWLDDMTADIMRQRAGQHEAILREAVASHLPRPLRWAAGHPRILRVLYLLRRRWRPTLYVGTDLGTSVSMIQHKDGTTVMVDEVIGVSKPPGSRDA